MPHIQSPEETARRFRRRVRLAAPLALLCLGVLATRLYHLQVTQQQYYATRAESNRISLVPIAPNRGNIEDRNGIILARNYSAFTLEVTPAKIPDLKTTLAELGRIVTIEPKDARRFERLLRESRNFDSILLRTRLTDEEVARFAVNRYRFPGVEVKARLFRQYPENTLAAHAIGYISRINEEEREWLKTAVDEDGDTQTGNYKGATLIGKIGLEKQYEFILHGLTGYEQVEIDAGGHAVRVLERSAPTPGNNLVLTLDTRLQRMAEAAFGERRGALVALDPRNGEILALVSSPSFDPNLFVDGIRFDDWDALNNHPDKPMLNRAIYSAYPPGSTFKPMMAMAALTQGKRTPEQTISDPGYFSFGGHVFMDDKRGGHGIVDMYRSIVSSCNTYYYRLANDMGIESIAAFMRQIGLGSRTGIDIPGETAGVLPSPEWKQKRFSKPQQQKWFAGETISVGIGQGYNAYTALQMAHALANILNGGRVFRPHLVRAIRDSTTGETRRLENAPVREIPLNPEHVAFIKRAMEGVNKQGTGARAFAGAAYASGGKTGTAQVFSLRGQRYSADRVKERLRDHSWFIAFAPVEQPGIVVAVMVENAGFGAVSAAPIARQVLDFHFTGHAAEGPAPEDRVSEEEGAEPEMETDPPAQPVPTATRTTAHPASPAAPVRRNREERG
ncbi:MAG: penicillin-binding protein 2 [Zoogloeaceae bacterium]|jgi:penicillin-binding protein 2|nr:penicillin-binding protein 2 [Zoogloeaceae bacterium]